MNMNFIVVVSDTLRRDFLGCYGNEWISTPSIDDFAKESIVFDRAYLASFPTVPNRHDILTGRYTFTYAQWAPLPKDELVLAEALKEAGYISMMILDCPKIVENGFNYDRGFTGWEWIRGQESDRWRTAPRIPEFRMAESKQRRGYENLLVHYRNTDSWEYEEDTFVARTMNSACRWLERNHRQHDGFFLYVDTFDPHEPWDAPPWYVDMYDPGYEGDIVNYPIYGSSDYLTDQELDHARAEYAAEVTLVDRWVGRLFDKIRDLGLLENTVVLFTTDHGFYLGEHGLIGKTEITPEWTRYLPLYEEVAHIPLLIHFPGIAPRRENAIVQPPDIMPTLLDLAGVVERATLHGRSLVPLITGEVQRLYDFAVSSPTIVRGGVGGVRPTITTSDWSLVLSGRTPEPDVYETMDVDGFAKPIKIHETFPSELYHLPDDPLQEDNVLDRNTNVANDLQDQFVAFLERVHTPAHLVEYWRR